MVLFFSSLFEVQLY